jgi:holo-ACP synthase
LESQTREATLEDILRARDRRAEKQKQLIQEYALPLVSYTINIPGAIKSSPLYIRIFEEGLVLLGQGLSAKGVTVIFGEAHYRFTGPEAFIVADRSELALKKLVLQLEDSHQLGRIFDFDVLGLDFQPISREMLGYPQRRCLLCDDLAQVCARSRRHPVDKLKDKICSMSQNYFKHSGYLKPTNALYPGILKYFRDKNTRGVP